jgi:hypothetical protein
MAVEFLEGKPVYHRGEDLPLKAMMFGGPYDRYFKEPPGGGGTEAKPSIVASHLARLDNMLRAHKPVDTKAGVDYAFRILKQASAPNTTWSLVFDVKRKILFIRTYKNQRVRHIAFADLDFSCRTPVMMLDAHAKVAGDLSDHFQEYSHEATLKHALESVAFHRPDMAEEIVQQMLQHMESYPCVGGN